MTRKSFDLGDLQVHGAVGFDALFAREPQHVTPLKTASKVRVASIQELSPFIRLGTDTLIHKSDRDLWAIKKDADGGLIIERMFDDNGDPLRG